MKLSNKRGFLFFELVVSLLLLIIFSTGLFVSYRWISRFVVQTELDAMILFFHHLQQHALVEGKECIVVIDQEKQSYYQKDAMNTTTCFLSKDLTFAVLPDVKGPPSNPRTHPEKTITFVNSEIIFYQTGIISSGIIYIADVTNQNQYAISNAVASYSTLRLYRYTKDEKWILL